jgi:hypothetical protein
MFFACVPITIVVKKNHKLKYNEYNWPIITLESENMDRGHYLDSLSVVRVPQKDHNWKRSKKLFFALKWPKMAISAP